MTNSYVHDELTVLELIAWEVEACPCMATRSRSATTPIVLNTQTAELAPLLANVLVREDLQQEFAGLTWSLAVIDLRTLHAFQRRLIFDPTRLNATSPAGDDWPALMKLAFNPPRPIVHTFLNPITIQSENPDLHLRPTRDGFQLHGGSPFFEVALYRGRAFLRDGYHRAFSLLKAGIHAIPAVVIEARTFAEVCFESPDFFPESILFSPHPPMVTDFLNPALTYAYTTPRIFKTLHLPAKIDLTKEYHP